MILIYRYFFRMPQFKILINSKPLNLCTFAYIQFKLEHVYFSYVYVCRLFNSKVREHPYKCDEIMAGNARIFFKFLVDLFTDFRW